MTRPCCLPFLLITFLVSAGGSSLRADEAENLAFFNDQVFPILEKNCFKCHGAGDHLKGDFRITSREGLIHGGHFGPGYNEAEPEKSVLLEMISYKSEKYEMPPKGKLPEAEIAILTEWIDRGAPYDPAVEIKGDAKERRGFTITDADRDWWAYRPVSKNDPPEVDDPEWSRNGIDAFIKSQLDREGLKPNPLASPQVLVRRVFYDLLGLPPQPAEVQQFVNAYANDAEKAYRDLVEDLLSRPQYGEKWARHWLDVVRYAESNGFERDNTKPHIWKYRDYVIEAFNKDKPYDQFVIEQIAGDEIENPTMESMTATGYHRLMQWDDEPADRKQHVYDVLADNVQVTSEAFLATTLGCARCHDHKADPVSQKDYYSFMAFFGGVTHYKTEGTLVSWASPEEKAKFEEERDRNLQRLGKRKEELETQLRPILEAQNRLKKGSGKIVTFVESARSGGANWEYTTTKPTPDWSDVGFRNKSWFKAPGGFGASNPPNAKILTEWKTNEIWARTSFGLTSIPGSLVVELYHDEDVEIYLNGSKIYEASGYTTNYETINLTEKARNVLQTGRNTLAVHCVNTGGGQYLDLALREQASDVSIEKILSGRPGDKVAKQVDKESGKTLATEYRQVIGSISSWRTRKPGVPLNVVTESGANPAPMHIHLRGSAHALGDEVSPGLPAVLASDGGDPATVDAEPIQRDGRASSGRRLALAEWLVDEENPLTARVMVNRIWQHHFGRGIVPSTSDFGQLGEKPTHPELLDWLANQFVENGWSMKEMHRQILHSRTYRMSSDPESANLAVDPQNNHFWRYSMRRLTAEELRDTILAVSGNLNLESHGPWVYPPLPPEVLATASRPGKGWPISKNESDHYRRSVYIHVKRSLRYQMLADFDQADTDTACAVRFTTTVPTQALAMLNSKFVNDQAVVFAGKMRAEGETVRDQIAAGLSQLFQREATTDELDHLEALYQKFQTEAGLSEQEALDRIALLALNLNEFIYLD